MNRRKSREQAFVFLFESAFNLQEIDEIVKQSELVRKEELDDFSKLLFYGTTQNISNIDKYIESNLNGWQKNRLSYVALSVLRLCVYEMLYCDDIPSGVSINEAVELAKKYGSPEEASYINGVLGSVAKQLGKGKKRD